MSSDPFQDADQGRADPLVAVWPIHNEVGNLHSVGKGARRARVGDELPAAHDAVFTNSQQVHAMARGLGAQGAGKLIREVALGAMCVACAMQCTRVTLARAAKQYPRKRSLRRDEEVVGEIVKVTHRMAIIARSAAACKWFYRVVLEAQRASLMNEALCGKRRKKRKLSLLIAIVKAAHDARRQVCYNKRVNLFTIAARSSE